jgi:hypothetical protein
MGLVTHQPANVLGVAVGKSFPEYLDKFSNAAVHVSPPSLYGLDDFRVKACYKAQRICRRITAIVSYEKDCRDQQAR